MHVKENEEIEKHKKEIENKIELISNEINLKERAIKETKDALELNLKIKKEELKLKYLGASKIEIEDNVNIQEEQKYINNLKLTLSQKELEIKQILQKLEDLVEIEENLNLNKENYEELIEYNEVIEIAKEALDAAYLKMRESITPKFTNNLSNLVNSITDGRYKKVKVNEESGLLLETKNRKLYNRKLSKPRHNRPTIFITKNIKHERTKPRRYDGNIR